jgi:hypothetical protein
MGRYELADAPGPSMEAFLEALRAAYSNGGVLCARFHAVAVQDPGEWFHTGSTWHRNQTFQDLFNSDVARGAFPELQLPIPWPVADPPLFFGGAGGTLTLDDEWARCLVNGEAYRRFPGRAAEAKALTASAVGELIGDRHEDCEAHEAEHAWTPWFFDVAWDHSWIIVDRRQQLVTVLLATDTD